MSDAMLKLIRRLSVEVKGDETLTGCCSAVALMVHRVLGGEVLEGFAGEQPHYWNRLPSGHEVDLTSSQFGGDGWHPCCVGTPIEPPKLIPLPLLFFAGTVLTLLQDEQEEVIGE